ncbi:Glucosamine-6-phosphate deaminase [Budvicia aquatica]|uniref:Glucosamine-6-phosphate deaminase n=1 Tax=Budvicia aquatica TaxID=82979 RepID=A0A484ZNJ0_9GAMM|nr:Glucosamine-6-phosphate deaminase [Budvicia aquatica]
MRLIPLESSKDVGLWSARHIVNRINAFKPTATALLFWASRQAAPR